MTGRRFASGIAGAAGLIAVTTLFARLFGFARILVFTEAVRSGGVGGIYQTVNAIPNVLFEIAAGGILAAIAVPLIAHQLGPGSATGPTTRHPCCSRGPCWSWCRWRGCSGWARARSRRGSSSPTTRAPPRWPPRLLRIFAVQVPLYGLGIILTGLLQAHRRFLAAALAPLASSIVVLVSYLWYGDIVDGQTAPSLVSDEAVQVLGWGTTLGVVVLSVPLIVPARAHRLALAPRAADAARRRPTDRLPGRGRHHRPARPAGRRRRHDVALAAVGRRRHVHRLHLRAGRLPAAVRRARRAGGHQRLPGARGPHRRRRGRHRHPRALAAGRARADRAVGGRADRGSPRHRRVLLAARRPPRQRGHEHRRARGAARDDHGVRAGPGGVRPHRPADPRPLRPRPADRRGARRGAGLELGGAAAAPRARRGVRARRRRCAGWASRRRWA